MKRDIQKTVNIPAGIECNLEDRKVIVSGKGKKIEREMIKNDKISIKREGDTLSVSSKKATKRESKLIGSLVAHVKNMIHGIDNEYKYRLEICNVHFPMTVKTEGSNFKIKNFLGEKVERVAKILPGAKLEVKGNIIEISSPDIEAAGQTAANIEIATKIRNRDRRVFQDGIFIIEKPGRN